MNRSFWKELRKIIPKKKSINFYIKILKKYQRKNCEIQ